MIFYIIICLSHARLYHQFFVTCKFSSPIVCLPDCIFYNLFVTLVYIINCLSHCICQAVCHNAVDTTICLPHCTLSCCNHLSFLHAFITHLIVEFISSIVCPIWKHTAVGVFVCHSVL